MKPKKSNREALLMLPYVHERDGNIYVRVPIRNGSGKTQHKERKLHDNATPEEAINRIAELRLKYGANPARLDSLRMTFDSLLAEYKRAHPNLPAWYEQPLEFFKGRKIRSITYADCLAFKKSRQEVKRLIPDPANRKEKLLIGRKPATINRELEILRGVLLYAVRHGWLDRNPMLAADKPLIEKWEEEGRERIPAPGEEERLLAACVAPRAHLRPLIIAASDTGLRRGALLSLQWSMVDWEDRLLSIPRGNRYKRRPRLIGMTDRLWSELRSQWEEQGRPADGKIFGAGKDFKRAYTTACRIAGVVGLQFRDFRHKFATDLMEAGVEERLAMKIVGHTNTSTHAIYTNVDQRLARQVADALNKLHAGRYADGNDLPLASELPQ